MNSLDEKTREVMAASYALPDLETAVQQAIYNCVDARAKTITLSVDVPNASFTVVDDGDGMEPSDLYTYIGEQYASSRLPPSEKAYGKRGAFLFETTSLATRVDIESRVRNHWTSYRKIFENGKVVFNARSKDLRETSGTKVSVSNLFANLPVRRKALYRTRHQDQVIQNIRNFCSSMSMIWPSLTFLVWFEAGERTRSLKIIAANSCRERFLRDFGPLLGNELQYVSFSSKIHRFTIRGYFAFIPSGREDLAQGIKQARFYYQFAFLGNEWVEECQQICSKVLTEAALEALSAIPIFVLKIEASSDEYVASRIGQLSCALFKDPEQFYHFLKEFIQNLVARENERTQINLQPDPRPETRFGGVPQSSKYLVPGYSFAAGDGDHTENKAFPDITQDAATHIYFSDAQISEQQNKWQNQSSIMCQSCGYVDTYSANDIIESVWSGGNDTRHDNEGDNIGMTYRLASDEHYGFVDKSESRGSDTGAFREIFFCSEPKSFAAAHKGGAGTVEVKPNTSTTSPWISSKPDSYDCADTFLSWNQMRGCSCTAYNHLSISGHQDYRNQNTRKPQNTQVDLCEAETYDSCTRLPLPLPIPDDTKSSYFDTDKAVECLSSFQYPPLRLTAALRVKKVHILNEIQTIKLNKSTLAEMKVIRQVDRKFILVQANTSEGRLLLCIDQHAADERVRLEKFEADMFSYDGSLKRVEVSKYDPPLILRLNSRECEMLHRYENHIRKWGFDFELTPAQEPESMLNMRSDTNAQGLVHVLLYATPTVEKRSLSVEDFRDFLQLLSSNGGTTLCSSVRPPAITRLLHSRACRSAIMFGDFLSTAQCEELLNELKTCQLPFQCAHGRPSIVPLAQIQSRDHNDNQ